MFVQAGEEAEDNEPIQKKVNNKKKAKKQGRIVHRSGR